MGDLFADFAFNHRPVFVLAMLFKYVQYGLVLLGCVVFCGYYVTLRPYMDEIFHIPQAQQYCKGNFSHWDPKITTFPGLYIVSFGFIQVLRLVEEVACHPGLLRCVNVALSIVLCIVLHRCGSKVYGSQTEGWRLAAILSSYPLNAFYYFLYYTDTLSTTSLVLLYWLACHPMGNAATATAVDAPQPIRRLTIFFVAVLSVLARQTNVVWILFILGTSMLNHVQKSAGPTDAALLRSDTLSINQLVVFVLQLWKHVVALLIDSAPLLLIVVGFVVFVIKNGGVVLGDKDNHKPVLHWAMVVHMLFISSLVSAPDTLAEAVDWLSARDAKENKSSAADKVVRWVRSSFTLGNLLLLAAVCGATTLALVYGSHSHPFLLADNRHYTFYLWKRVLSHQKYRVLLAPVYCVGVVTILRRLSRNRGALWVLIFLTAAIISLVPTPLLEPRYFTPGVVIAVLNSAYQTPDKKDSHLKTVLSLLLVLLFAAVNAVTVYVFLFRTFTWSYGSVGRFMY